MAIFHSSKYHVLEMLNQKNPKKFKNNYYSGAFLAAVELKSSTPSASVRKCDLTLWLVNKLWSEVPDADLCSVSSSETAVLALRDKGVSSSFLCRYSKYMISFCLQLWVLWILQIICTEECAQYYMCYSLLTLCLCLPVRVFPVHWL